MVGELALGTWISKKNIQNISKAAFGFTIYKMQVALKKKNV